jgi:hypothetical protein
VRRTDIETDKTLPCAGIDNRLNFGRQLPDPDFDNDLLEGRDTDQHIVARVGDQRPRASTQSIIIGKPPQKRMRIEQ